MIELFMVVVDVGEREMSKTEEGEFKEMLSSVLESMNFELCQLTSIKLERSINENRKKSSI